MNLANILDNSQSIFAFSVDVTMINYQSKVKTKQLNYKSTFDIVQYDEMMTRDIVIFY